MFYSVSMGDPRGVGPDLILKSSLDNPDFKDAVVFGSRLVLNRRAQELGLPEFRGIVVEPEALPEDPLRNPGQTAFCCLEDSVTSVLEGGSSFLVTCPINKEAMAEAGFKFPGHTEYLASRSGVTNFHMMMSSPGIKVILTTIHEAIASVPSLITADRVSRAIEAGIRACIDDFGILNPAIAVCGLNPHCGEGGMFGHEEIDEIIPGIQQVRKKYPRIKISDPVSADTVFYRAKNGDWDMIIAMYHDQGLAGIKSTDFFTTVNVTLGLGWIRTSPDHGTAIDIAGKGIINTGSFVNSISTGILMAGNRKHGK
ncbi:MAG: 4-hydroxythreonine-4-phosphate dehydrogenase PdxA [Deltaproteobacteria bacterium]|nr:4-hydroxythreonine-4-phosphate dehydrogenase PdxA [Deltaproteobacteria bacterium]